MIKKLTFGKTDETFALLGDFIPGFSKDRALNGIGLQLKTEIACDEYTAKLMLALSKAQIEHLKLQKLKAYYNTTFPSDNKDCLSTPHRVYNVVKGTMAEIKQSILKFCPKNSRNHPGLYSTPIQTMNYSLLCNKAPYVQDMYPDLYPPYVQKMLRALEGYMEEVQAIILLAKELLDEEREIRNNDEYLKEIEASSRKDIEETATIVLDSNLFDVSSITVSREEYERRQRNAKNASLLRKELYHNISIKDFKKAVFIECYLQGVYNSLTPEESKIWTKAEDYDFVKTKVRPAIEGISTSEDLPSVKTRNADTMSIKADFIACFIVWCRVPKKHYTAFLNFIKPKLANLPLCFPAYSSITGALGKTIKAKSDYEAKFYSYSKMN